MSESLKPCPFCGSRDQQIKTGMIDGKHPVSAVYCMACGGSGAYAEIQDHAIESWNRRFPDETPAPAGPRVLVVGNDRETERKLAEMARRYDVVSEEEKAAPPEAARRWRCTQCGAMLGDVFKPSSQTVIDDSWWHSRDGFLCGPVVEMKDE